MSTSIKITCPDCGKEIKVLLHMVDKLVAENEALRLQLYNQNVKNTGKKSKGDFDVPDFMRDLFK